MKKFTVYTPFKIRRNVFTLLLLLICFSISTNRLQAQTQFTPGEFQLITPYSDTIIREVEALTEMQWEQADHAAAYQFFLFKLSNNSRVGDVANIHVPVEACGLQPGVCILPLSDEVRAQLTPGQYAWTVTALSEETSAKTSGEAASSVEASNAPYLLTINFEGTELVTNGGFEQRDAGGQPSFGAWNSRNLTSDKVVCNTALKPYSYHGECAFRFKGGYRENSRLTQSLDVSMIEYDATLALSAYIDADRDVGTIVQVKVKYLQAEAGVFADGKDKLRLEVRRKTHSYEWFEVQYRMSGTVLSAKLILSNHAAGGKIYLDNLSVEIRTPVARNKPAIDLPAVPLP